MGFLPLLTYSNILGKRYHRFIDLEIRRAFNVFLVTTVLEEARHSLVMIEHDPLLYEDAGEMFEELPTC
jgi:DNA polymerase I